MTNPEKVKDYQDRHVRWANESRKQLSFYNNLLLTLSVGFLSISFYKYTFNGIHFSWASFDWSFTFLVVSVIVITISIMVGLFVAINRLQDFRVSRQISFTRFRIYKHSNEFLKERTPDKFNYWKRLALAFYDYPTITIEECKAYKTAGSAERKNTRFKFKELRNISHNLGRTTWKLTVQQTLCFAIGIAFYILSILTK
ncbi:hypothetical protein [Aquiflexum sp.]|uniref:hypothetical protein n=1 Tax=Aquiflexum sp. TaxID=1872584 RepID=UPI003592F80C